MEAERIKKAYESAQNFITLLSSSYGESIRNEYPELVKKAEEIMLKYENQYMDAVIIHKPEAQNIVETIIELKETLELIDTTSYDSIKRLEDSLKENSEKLQSEILFEPLSFYKKYLLSITAPMSETLAESVLQNERFKAWFGNSKVVDEKGNPQVLYHGTSGLQQEFDEFQFKLFPGAYFAYNKSYSEWFAKVKSNYYMYNVFLRVENPIDISAYGVEKVTYEDFTTYLELKYNLKLPENKPLKAQSDAENGLWAWRYLRFGSDWLKYIKNLNYYDGILYYENNPSDIINGKENITKAYLVFDGNQIKSADIRNTTYSLESKNLKLAKGGKLC
jgi:hypothetical protein